jgi:hypothetical protein
VAIESLPGKNFLAWCNELPSKEESSILFEKPSHFAKALSFNVKNVTEKNEVAGGWMTGAFWLEK